MGIGLFTQVAVGMKKKKKVFRKHRHPRRIDLGRAATLAFKTMVAVFILSDMSGILPSVTRQWWVSNEPSEPFPLSDRIQRAERSPASVRLVHQTKAALRKQDPVQGAAGSTELVRPGDEAARGISAYLRLQSLRKRMNSEEADVLEKGIVTELFRQPDASMAAIAETLRSLEGDSDRDALRMRLFDLAYALPPTDNGALREAALAEMRKFALEGANPYGDRPLIVARAFMRAAGSDAQSALLELKSTLSLRTPPAVRKAYEDAFREYHPDLWGSEGAH